jgi:RNA polymerase sigma-70 factor (ECF subfamily)
MEDFTDEELVDRHRVARGQEADGALNQLFERHLTRVAGWCHRMTGDVDVATDLAQEVFLKAFQNLESFRGQSKFTTWLYAIARNHCMDMLKSRADAPVAAGESGLDGIEDARAGELLPSLERREAEQLVRRLMRESLDETEAKVMALHFAHEIPMDAVTRMLNLTNASGAKAYVVSARRKLVRALDLWRNREDRRKGGHAEPRTG